MEESVKDTRAKEPLPDEPALNAEQRELLRSLHRSFQQAARGETRDFLDLLRELRLEREAEENADNSYG